MILDYLVNNSMYLIFYVKLYVFKAEQTDIFSFSQKISVFNLG